MVFLVDHCRVKLEAIPAIEGSDYINASYVPVSIIWNLPFFMYKHTHQAFYFQIVSASVSPSLVNNCNEKTS